LEKSLEALRLDHQRYRVLCFEDFRPLLPKLLERTIAAFESNSPPGYAKHGSLLFGDMGAALLAMRPAPTSNLADLVHARAEANTGLPSRELMWGMPGSMLAAVYMAEMTNESRWRDLLQIQAARLFADLEDTPQGMNRRPSADIVHLGDARPPVSNKRRRNGSTDWGPGGQPS
jgi:hypothetical protein